MRKILVVLFAVLVSAGAFADFQIGPYAAYKFPISSNDSLPGLDEMGIEDFWFGADARLNISIFQATLVGVYMGGVDSSVPARLALTATGGVAFDLAIIRLGIGVGPAFLINLEDSDLNPLDVGIYGRGYVDVMLGSIALSFSVATQINLTGTGDILDYNNFTVNAGLSVLFKLF